MGYRLSRAAEGDLVHLYRTGVGAFGIEQAEAYFAELGRAFDFVSDFPRAARERFEINPPVRVHRHKAHLIVYVLEASDVTILRIRHGREDWSSDM